MAQIHPQAIVSDRAELAADVRVGPFCVVEEGVRIGAGTVLHSHVIVRSGTTLGSQNEIFQFVTMGEKPQDLKYQGEETFLHIGDHNVIRESVTVHRGTGDDQSLTQIGDHNLIMAYCHIAHDCMLGSHIIMANNSSLAGHVRLGDHANLGGFTLAQQHRHIGNFVHTGKSCLVDRNIPPFLVVSHPLELRGINRKGMGRKKIDDADIEQMEEAYQDFYFRRKKKKQEISEALAAIERSRKSALVLEFVQFIRDSCAREEPTLTAIHRHGEEND